MKKQSKSRQAKVASAPAPAKQFKDVVNIGLRSALEAAGGYPQLGAALGVSRQSVHKWEVVPDRFAVRIEELYGIPRHITAPHLYKGMAAAK